MNKPLGPQGLAPLTGFSFLSLLINNFIPITLFVVAASLGGMLWWKDRQITSLEKKVSALQTQVDEKTTQVNTCQTDFAALRNDVKDMSQQVNKIKEDAEQILGGFQAFRIEVDRDFANQEKRLRDLRNIQTPRSCEESIELLRKRIEETTWKTLE